MIGTPFTTVNSHLLPHQCMHGVRCTQHQQSNLVTTHGLLPYRCTVSGLRTINTKQSMASSSAVPEVINRGNKHVGNGTTSTLSLSWVASRSVSLHCHCDEMVELPTEQPCMSAVVSRATAVQGGGSQPSQGKFRVDK